MAAKIASRYLSDFNSPFFLKTEDNVTIAFIMETLRRSLQRQMTKASGLEFPQLRTSKKLVI